MSPNPSPTVPTCIVCGEAGYPFCGEHARASSGKRGGWLSAHRRQLMLAGAQAPGLHFDASNLIRGLWVGSKPPLDQALPMFSMVVLCAKEHQPDGSRWAARVLRVPLDDAEPTRDEIFRAVSAARVVAEELRRGGRTLVTCYAGLNRSVWVSSMAILMTRPKATADQVITLVRKRRSEQALGNPHFEKVIRSIWVSRKQR